MLGLGKVKGSKGMGLEEAEFGGGVRREIWEVMECKKLAVGVE